MSMDAPRNEAVKGSQRATSTITPLHIALWNGNLRQIDEGLDYHPDALETRDPRGNRALHLALKFAHRNSKRIVKRLVAAGARVRSRDADGWKAVHHAIASENEDILRVLVQREKAQAPALLQSKLRDASPRLAEVPDFYGEIHVDVSTWIPGVSRWLPSDTVKIWKRGPDIRFDITLIGYEHGAWKRGDLSFVLFGEKQHFFCLDHVEQTCTNLLSPGHALAADDLDCMVHFLMTTSIMTTEIDASELTFQRKYSWFSKTDQTETIGNWQQCDVYEMDGVVARLHVRKPQNKDHKAPAALAEETQSSVLTSDTLATLTSAAPLNERFVDVTIPAKADHVASVEVSSGEKVQWKFVLESCDIGFSVRFLPETIQGNKEVWQTVVALRRYSSNGGKEHVGGFVAPTTGTLVCTWDNWFSVFRQKRIRFALTVEAIEGVNIDDSIEGDEHRASEEVMTFEDWFGTTIDKLPPDLAKLHPKHRIMVHSQPPSRTISKSFPATVYMSKEFPLNVEQFLPVIEVLSKTTSAFENVQEFFHASLADGFPVQFCFPLIPSVSATFRFECLRLKTPAATLFTLPSQYTMYQEDVLSPRTHHEMLQNLTAV